MSATTAPPVLRCVLCGREGRRAFQVLPAIPEHGIPEQPVCTGRTTCRRRRWRDMLPEDRQREYA